MLAHTGSEIMWMRSLLHEMKVMVPILMKMYCDNQPAIFITSNLVFHGRTKHVEVDCYFIGDLMIKKHIITPYFRSEDQLGDILTKLLARSPFSVLCNKLDMFNLYASALGGC